MGIPAHAFAVQRYSQLRPGQLFQWRGAWCFKSQHTAFGPPRRDTDIAVKLTLSEAGRWVPESQIVSGELLVVAPEWSWRPEIDVGSIRHGEVRPLGLIISTAGLSVGCNLDHFWTFAGLNGIDHLTVLGTNTHQLFAHRWQGVLVSPDGSSTWPLFDVEVSQAGT